ncbi:hypothetical protein RUM44_009843 [Polyplax serrata]|uniref:C3H1-type domain-containing protein n=1 Tax=Polyplax serrata TaxID=468196 RepID=A0ABR1AUD9_POLSC
MYNPRGLFHYKSFGSKSLFLWRKHNIHNKIKENKTKNSLNRRIVKIGGIFYKAASNKLIVAESKKKVKTEGQRIKVNTNKKKVRKNHIVYVRGEKFSLHKNGKTLVRESQGVDKKSNSGTLRRIDIGGVTYLQKSKNILIRTNVHQARQIVNNAKHKSIATLCKLRKRSALPCMIYHKFGKCARHKKGLCMYKHDPKNIAVCRKFLKGNCDGSNCLLSHEIIQEKMATCHFFLNGCCNRDNCSFLHVKISESAEICKNFLHGFCDLGENCDKKHLFQCPKYEKDGKCSLGNKCPYPHKSKKCTKNYKTDKKSNNSVPCTSKQRKTKGKEKEERPILTLSNHQTIDKSVSATSDQITPEIECVPQRVKLDKLPAFIPLQSDV